MEEVAVSTLMLKPRKTSDGKRKIDVTKKVENKSRRKVIFSKRKKGLFKKCDELCSKFGAEIAAIVFSEAGNLFPYGNPNLDYVLERYRNYDGVNNGVNCGGFWWDEVEVDKLGLSELEEFKVALERLKNQVVSRVDGINRDYFTSNQGFGFDNSMERSRNEVVSNVVNIKLESSMSNQGFGFDNSMEMSRNGVASSEYVDIKPDFSMSNNQGFGFDNSLEKSRNEVVSIADNIKQDYSSDQGFGFDNSLERSRNEVFSSVDDITQDFKMSNQGTGFDDFDYDDVFAGSINDQFGSDFDFNFGFSDLNKNGLGPEVHVTDTKLTATLAS